MARGKRWRRQVAARVAPASPVPLDTADRYVVELLARTRRSSAPPSVLVRDLFRGEGLRPRQQKRIVERLHHVLANAALLDHAVCCATPAGSVVPALRDPVRVLMARVLVGDLAAAEAAFTVPWIDWPRVAGLRAEVRQHGDPVERLALVGALPPWLARRLVAQYGDEAEPLVEALTARAPVTLRANALRASRASLAQRLLADGIETTPTAHAAAGLVVRTPAQLFRHPAFADGWFEMQDEASQLVAELVAPPPGGTVLDVCAGAGGKTLALSALLGNRGEVLAVDADAGRLAELRRRARRAGAHNVRALAVGAGEWPAEVAAFAARADRLLLDVPCSGFGALRRHPEMRARATEAELRRLAEIQRALLARAAAALRPGARLVYATCTVLAEENEQVVEELLARRPELRLVPVVEVLGGTRGRPVADGSGRYLAMFPHVHGSDGFFAAVVRRPAAAPAPAVG